MYVRAMATNLTNERSPLARLFLAFEFDVMVKVHAKRAGSSVTDVLNEAIARLTRSINSNNRRGKPGRQPKEDWALICGMDPVDALMLPVVMERLGHQWPMAEYDKLIEKHAIARGGALLKNVSIRGGLKNLRQRQCAEISLRFEQAKEALPLDQEGLMASLRELFDRAGLR